MHVLVTVGSADPKSQDFEQATQCLVVFVAVDGDGRPRTVPSWQPETAAQRELQVRARDLAQVRTDIESAMADQTYTRASTAPFLAAPTDVNWGGKVHGGTVMRWIDEAAYVTGTRWAGGPCIAVYAGGIRFYRPLLIGSVVEVEARLLYTGRSSMHISVHVRSGDPKTDERALTTHSLIIFVALGEQGRSALVPTWEPETPGDQALERHARHLVELRKRLAAS
jgi:4-hydroxybenzoyl-CoA thioesterase